MTSCDFKKLLDRSALQTYNWTGRNGKTSILNSRIFDVIKGKHIEMSHCYDLMIVSIIPTDRFYGGRDELLKPHIMEEMRKLNNKLAKDEWRKRQDTRRYLNGTQN